MLTTVRPRRTVVGGVRGFNRRVLNPLMVRLAGRRHWYAAALHHVGHRSGRQYTTPVVAELVPDGVVVPLPYGVQVDWLRNVVAAGRATIDVRGRRHTVIDPQIVDAATTFPLLPPSRRRIWSVLRVKSYLWMRTLPTVPPIG